MEKRGVVVGLVMMIVASFFFYAWYTHGEVRVTSPLTVALVLGPKVTASIIHPFLVPHNASLGVSDVPEFTQPGDYWRSHVFLSFFYDSKALDERTGGKGNLVIGALLATLYPEGSHLFDEFDAIVFFEGTHPVAAVARGETGGEGVVTKTYANPVVVDIVELGNEMARTWEGLPPVQGFVPLLYFIAGLLFTTLAGLVTDHLIGFLLLCRGKATEPPKED